MFSSTRGMKNVCLKAAGSLAVPAYAGRSGGGLGGKGVGPRLGPGGVSQS